MADPIVFVRGGLVEGVAGAANFFVVDYDILEGGSCPVCKGDIEMLENGDAYCPECDMNWDEDPSELDIGDVVYRTGFYEL
jgi:hypothetical protein